MAQDQVGASNRLITHGLNQFERVNRRTNDNFALLIDENKKLRNLVQQMAPKVDYISREILSQSEESREFRDDLNGALDQLDDFKDQMKKDIACINEQLSRISGMIMQVVNAHG